MPSMQLCPNGHYFDSERYASCPYCKAGNGPGVTEAFDGDRDVPPTEAFVDTGDLSGRTMPAESEETVGLDILKGTKIVPVVGWLVCTEGSDKGKDFRLHAGNNFVGRSPDRDVYLRDPSVSRKHFSVSYDQRKDRWFTTMWEGKEIVYVNDEPISNATPLKKGDLIEVANTKLVFIPLEREYVEWEW